MFRRFIYLKKETKHHAQHMFQIVSGHNSEQILAYYRLRPSSVSQLETVSDTISNVLENHQPLRTQTATVSNAPFIQSSNVDVNHSDFSTSLIFKVTSRFLLAQWGAIYYCVIYYWTDTRQNLIYLLNRNTSGSLGENRNSVGTRVSIKQLDYELEISILWQLTRAAPSSTITHRNRERIPFIPL